MERGACYTYNVDAYPRYKYFHQRLHGLLPRWQKILEAGGLPDCILQGKQRLKEIISAAQTIGDKVSVNLFADDLMLKSQDFTLTMEETSYVEKQPISWSSYTEQAKTEVGSLKQNVTVIMAGDKHQEIIADDLKLLPVSQQKNIIIFNVDSEISNLFTSLDKDDFSTSKTKQPAKEWKTERSKILASQVQFLLEENLILVFEKIADYMKCFIPKMEKELDQPLTDSVQVMLIRSLSDPFVVKDLSPYEQESEKPVIPTDQELLRVSEHIGLNWDNLGPALGITYREIDNLKLKYPGRVPQQIFQMLCTWREKKGKDASMGDLLQILKDAPAIVNIDLPSLKDLTEKYKGSTSSHRDEIFHRKLTEFVCKKTKCVVCDDLSKKYGISASLVNEFMNTGFFDYEKKVAEMLKSISMPRWPQGRSESGVSTCKNFSFRCGMSLTKLLQESEDYVKRKLKILTEIKKLQFELFGYMLQSDVQPETEIPEIPLLPLDLQFALLDIPEILGCGTCYGELVLHVKYTLVPAKRTEVKDVLKAHNYTGGFKTEVIAERKEHVRGLLLEHGKMLRAKKTTGVEFSHGSAGCLVRITPKQRSLQIDQAKAGAMPSTAYVIQDEKDHCLTCAHCLEDCNDPIEVKHRDSFEGFGIKSCFLYEKDAIDVASVQIFDEKLPDCDSKLQNSQQEAVNNWRVFEFDPLRRDVHKEGCHGFTKGIVMSTDFSTQNIKAYNIKIYEKEREKRRIQNENYELRTFLTDCKTQLHIMHSILVEPLPGAGDIPEDVMTGQQVDRPESTVEPFSKKGDSGSVICSDDPDRLDTVNVVAILIGAVYESDNNGEDNNEVQRYLHSYGSLMNRVIAVVEEQFNCTIRPSCLPPASQGAVGGAEGS